MAYLSETDKNKIEKDLKNLIESKLLDGYKNRKSRLIIEVTNVNVEYEVDEKKTNRDKITICPVLANANVWVDNNDNNSKGNDQLELRINSVNFLFNEDSKNYEIEDDNDLVLIDMSN